MGPSALAGFAIFFILVPIQQRIMAHQIRVRRQSTKFTESRAGVIMEVLSSMKIVKYFCYEIPFLKSVFSTVSVYHYILLTNILRDR
jgi:ATP-binding cassette, subfamily C (CFTR/MRP), member 1